MQIECIVAKLDFVRPKAHKAEPKYLKSRINAKHQFCTCNVFKAHYYIYYVLLMPCYVNVI